MSFANSPEAFFSLHVNADHAASCSFKEYEEQIIAYFSGRSDNTRFQWDLEKLNKRFTEACKQMERFMNLPEKG
jgi:hypothetical protein